jgi:hypothetical protein
MSLTENRGFTCLGHYQLYQCHVDLSLVYVLINLYA